MLQLFFRKLKLGKYFFTSTLFVVVIRYPKEANDGLLEYRRQSAFLSAVNASFRYGKLEPLLSEQAKQVGTIPFLPLSVSPFLASRLETSAKLTSSYFRTPQPSSSTSQRNLIILFTASVLPMRPTVQAAPSDILILLRELMMICLEPSASEIQRIAGMQGLGAGINKWMDCKFFSSFFFDFLEIVLCDSFRYVG